MGDAAPQARSSRALRILAARKSACQLVGMPQLTAPADPLGGVEAPEPASLDWGRRQRAAARCARPELASHPVPQRSPVVAHVLSPTHSPVHLPSLRPNGPGSSSPGGQRARRGAVPDLSWELVGVGARLDAEESLGFLGGTSSVGDARSGSWGEASGSGGEAGGGAASPAGSGVGAARNAQHGHHRLRLSAEELHPSASLDLARSRPFAPRANADEAGQPLPAADGAEKLSSRPVPVSKLARSDSSRQQPWLRSPHAPPNLLSQSSGDAAGAIPLTPWKLPCMY